MVTQMTREEYRQRFGEEPIIRSESNIDITPAKRIMTRAEYDREFGLLQEQQKTGIFTSIGNAINKVNPIYQIPKVAIEAGLKTSESLKRVFTAESPTEALKGTLGATAGTLQGALAVPIGLFESATNLPGVKQVKDFLWDTTPGKATLPNIVGDKISDLKPIQDFVTKYEDSPEIAGDIIMTVLGTLGVRGAKNPKLKSEIQAEWKSAYDKAQKVTAEVVGTRPETSIVPSTGLTKATGGSGIIGTAVKARVFVDNAKQQRLTDSIEKELYDIENSYAKTRKAMEYQKDAGSASRRRIAQTDVLVDAVDSDGIIRTKQPGGAIEQYKKQTIEGVESVVRDNLVRLGETVNLFEVKNKLTIAINESGLEGADLIRALNGIEKEIEGLALRADNLGNIPLERIHDAKISTTRNIDYNTPPETKTYRKSIARGYKKTVENKSSFNVEEVNSELSKYYKDIELLENLDGRRVKGGRLGKYFAQVSGNIIGGAAGSIGGPAGTAIGTIIGGEAASLIKGQTMKGTFGPGAGRVAPKSEIIELAKATAKTPPEFNLKAADPKIGVPTDIQKTKEVLKLERQISDNVELQKKAITSKDYKLVSALKQIYQALVEELKALVDRIKNTPNKEGGFMKNPLAKKGDQSKSRGNLNTQYNKTNVQNTNTISKVSNKTPNKSTGVSADLIKEARKYKSADEFVEAQPTLYHGTSGKFDELSSTYDLLQKGVPVEPSNVGAISKFVHLADDPKLARQYSSLRQKNIGGTGRIIEAVIPGKILDLSDNIQWDFTRVIREQDSLIKRLEDGGYSGVKFMDKDTAGRMIPSYAALPQKVKTKSQLKQIWEEANKTDDLITEARKYKSADEFVEVNGVSNIDKVSNRRKKNIEMEIAISDGIQPARLSIKADTKMTPEIDKYIRQRIYSVNIPQTKQSKIFDFISKIKGNTLESTTPGNLYGNIIGLDKADTRLTFRAGQGVSTKRFINLLEELQKKTEINLIKRKSLLGDDSLSLVDSLLKSRGKTKSQLKQIWEEAKNE